MEPRELAKYEVENGQEIVITDVDVRNVICKNKNVTDTEMKLFIELCKAQKLNPFIREAYLVKFGDNPATILTSKDVFIKRAARNTRFKGFRAGVTVINSEGVIERREGSMVGNSTERLIGGWCSVYIDGYDVPMFEEVSFSEYAAKKKDGGLNQQWASKPATMIRKVAVTHALREAFPEDLGGMYDSSEMGNLDPDPIEIPNEVPYEIEQLYEEDVVF